MSGAIIYAKQIKHVTVERSGEVDVLAMEQVLWDFFDYYHVREIYYDYHARVACKNRRYLYVDSRVRYK